MKKILCISQCSSDCTIYPGSVDSARPYSAGQISNSDLPSENGFSEHGDYWYGPGVLDMKAGIAMLFMVLRELYRVGLLHSIPIKIIVNSCHNFSTTSAQRLLEKHGIGADSILVLSRGRKQNNLVTRRSGAISFRVAVKGCERHVGSDYLQGASAISQLVRIIIKMESITNLDHQVIANVGGIEGGSGINIVSEEASATFEIRIPSIEEMHRVRDLVREFSRPEVEGMTVSICDYEEVAPREQTPASLALCNSFRACASKSGLRYGMHQRVGAMNEANRYISCGAQ